MRIVIVSGIMMMMMMTMVMMIMINVNWIWHSCCLETMPPFKILVLLSAIEIAIIPVMMVQGGVEKTILAFQCIFLSMLTVGD